jgi:DNA repair photolyase
MLRRLTVQNPESRFERFAVEYDAGETPEQGLQLYDDQSKSILSENKSPDLSFRFSLNAYRGCAHGCAYCYARPSHEYLGWGAGSDFERRILVKRRAPELLREAFERPSWRGDKVVISSNTDGWQPIESKLELTRRCLEVCVAYRNPVHVITRSALIERDLDLLMQLRDYASIGVSVSVTFWDPEIARAIEPYAPPPGRRIETIARLSAAGIPVIVHMAPLIPGLSDSDLLPILEAARNAGAISAMSMPVRLPGSVKDVFEQRLRSALPLRADKIMRRIREMRGGKLNESNFFERQRGKGQYADAIALAFEATTRRLGYAPFPETRGGTFRRPDKPGAQLRLF